MYLFAYSGSLEMHMETHNATCELMYLELVIGSLRTLKSTWILPPHHPCFLLQHTFSSLVLLLSSHSLGFFYIYIYAYVLYILYVYCFFPPVPEMIDGNTLTATVVDLNAWVEYEFRVLAKNSVGVGEPSPVSVRTRTEDAGTVKAVQHFAFISFIPIRSKFWNLRTVTCTIILKLLSNQLFLCKFLKPKAFLIWRCEQGLCVCSSWCSARWRGWRRWKQIWTGHHMGGKWSVLCCSLLLSQLILFFLSLSKVLDISP